MSNTDSTKQALLAAAQLEALRKIDSPTIANAIEAFDVRDRTDGYTSLELRCMFPELQPVIGYAVTCTVDSTSPGKRPPTAILDLYAAIEAAPKPAIVVMQDIGPDRLRSCHAGDVMSTIFQTLGAVAVVTDGGVRDLAGIKQRAPNFQLFAPGVVVSHGTASIIEIGMTVSISGLTIRPGDLLHGDANGLVSIPHAVADRVAAQAEKVWDRERQLVDFVKSSEFTLSALKERMTH
jgi:4-hydroxy-4-methyl-2-oxoglutarate aldolase